ncbi:hypothetical protein V6N12_042260 [Hibiscus sabdariffa]|uniref:Uncharacterized protein n=1 Tax=Hibiscus sabdariffa TaxID=183260 RepID=A0ABR2EGI3_9ROSI
MSLALDEVTLGGLNGGGAREEGMSGEVISVVRLREKNNVVSWRGNDLWEGSPTEGEVVVGRDPECVVAGRESSSCEVFLSKGPWTVA